MASDNARGHWTAWLTTDPSMLDGDVMDVVVLRDEITGYREGPDGQETPEWGSTGDPIFSALTTVDARDGDATDAIAEAIQALDDAGWIVVGDWDAVDTGCVAIVERRMSPAEFKVTREALGLSGAGLASLLHVSDRSVRHWEDGKYPVPDGVRGELAEIEAATADRAAALVAECKTMGAPRVTTYATDADYREAEPDGEFGASWHRAVVARVAREVPGLHVDYYAEDES